MSEQNSSTPASQLASEGRAIWTILEEEALISFLHKHKAEAGDGLNFKGATWTAAAEEMRQYTTKGGVKGASACRTKFTRVCTYFCQQNTLFILYYSSERHSTPSTNS
jgi:hypothetical protein